MLFQSIIIDKYIKNLSLDAVQSAYANFTTHFHNPTIQDNIRISKEEQYQEGFLRDLFVQIFGYMLNPADNYNLTTELKNLKGAKKCDGAILKDDKALAVIELKGMDTTDLSRIETQAFGYKNNHPTCRYVITSNFQKLRFYIDNAVEYLEFDLFKLDFEAFKLLYLLLQAENLLNDLPLKIKSESLSQEEKITHALYQDYSAFKRALFADLCAKNSQYNALELFAKTQKLLDRLLFIFFAEDSGLLSANTAHTMLIEWQKLKDLKMPISVYDQLKRYFHFLNTGYKDEHSEIFAYNGGLFKPDEILDSLIISDDILSKHIKKIADYNFASEIDVNILGHIFENSLNEIDEIKAELNGEKIDKKSTKRKKDGVFYTPKYITSYIIQNTIGKLCDDKKRESNLNDEDYITDKKRQKKTQETLLQKLKDYRAWLLDLTICDPACGSGAFLNESLNFLISEHAYLDELESKLFGGGLVFQEVRNHILEHNLFGVDINAESVEIAKLSLWLRTVEPHRKLSNLNQNIKCGNSLIDDVDVAGDKAFDWEKEFPQVFAKGGFDVVVGNPPYVQLQKLKDTSNQLEKLNYQTFEKTGDLYVLFYELAYNILKDNGLLGFITSNKWLRANYGKKLRQFLTQKTNPILLMDLGSGIFESATVDSNILIFEKNTRNYNEFNAITLKEERRDFENIEHLILKIFPQNDDIWTISSNIEQSIKQKIEQNGKMLRDWDIEINYGIKTGINDAFIIDENTKNELIAKDNKNVELIKPILRGRDIGRYSIDYQNLYLINVHNGYKNTPRIDIENYPTLKEFLNQFYDKLEKRSDKGATPYNLRNCAYIDNFSNEKIIYQEIVQYPCFAYSTETMFCNDTGRIITGKNLKFLLAIFNSKLFFYAVKNIYGGGGLGDTGVRMKHTFFEKFVVPTISESEQTPFITLADQMLSLNQALQTACTDFLATLNEEFTDLNLTKTLKNWHETDFDTLQKELKKQKHEIPLAKRKEWRDYFTVEHQKITDLQNQIRAIDDEINERVYKLYGLTQDEMKAIEG